MRDLFKKLKKRLADEEAVRYLKFIAIPLTVVILVFAVVAADRPEKSRETEPSDVSPKEWETERDTKDDRKEITLRMEKPGDEISGLMAAYWKAKKTCDINRLAKVYGSSVSSPDMELEEARMEEEVKYCQDYLNLVCYTVNGLTDGSLVVYSRFDIQFRQSETPAPSMFACYAKRGADEGWHVVARPSKEEADYIERVNQSDAVRAMKDEVNSGLRTALEEDSDLLSVYHTLMEDKGS